ncbi:hypothetical protein K523DRAFT_269778 [Schizophyllum commune Tattone D]|nr:hypothetical protein K525DRAFT_253811 [Schizophyllum commune Loenen D]KAI5831514.1 hypothetical protein K523DRAFT_269778 [Schizophyllum commune Tattone D]
MSSPLDSTYGLWLVSMFIMSILYGIGLLQSWLYFHWYSNDHVFVKSLVVILLVLETLQISWYFDGTYYYFVEQFGNFQAFTYSPWENSAQLLAAYLSAFVVQAYFAGTVWRLDKGRRWAAVVIMMLALASISAGIAQTVATAKLSSLTRLGETRDITTVQAATALATDLAITIALCFTFQSFKSGMQSTNAVLNNLIMYAVNRGVLTSLCALLNLVLFLALPGTFYFFIGLMPSSKLYMNTMLATLNTRQHIRTKTSGFSGASGGNSSDQATMPMPVSMGGGMSLGGMGGMGGMRQDYELPVHIHRQVEFSRDDSDMFKKGLDADSV